MCTAEARIGHAAQNVIVIFFESISFFISTQRYSAFSAAELLRLLRKAEQLPNMRRLWGGQTAITEAAKLVQRTLHIRFKGLFSWLLSTLR